MPAKRGAKMWASDGTARPARLAVTLDEAAETLGVPLRDVERAAVGVKLYIAHGGVPKWSVRELARTLADCGRVVPPELLRAPTSSQAQERKRRHRARTRG